MRTAISLSAEERPWDELVTYVLEAERLGVDICWVTEGWGGDAVSPLGFLAARTEEITFGSGVCQLGTRTPAAIAMAAMTLAVMSDNRFLLGLGASGPQVIEGLHGVRFDHPLGRMRETIEIIRLLCSGERSTYTGRYFQLPLEGSDVRPMRLSLPANAELPLYVAALSPKMLELTGELADGWLGTSFVPERADAFLDPITTGAERAGRAIGEIDKYSGTNVNDLKLFMLSHNLRFAAAKTPEERLLFPRLYASLVQQREKVAIPDTAPIK